MKQVRAGILKPRKIRFTFWNCIFSFSISFEFPFLLFGCFFFFYKMKEKAAWFLGRGRRKWIQQRFLHVQVSRYKGFSTETERKTNRFFFQKFFFCSEKIALILSLRLFSPSFSSLPSPPPPFALKKFILFLFFWHYLSPHLSFDYRPKKPHKK